MSKGKETEAPGKILKYLIDTNRPYSTIEITANLHKEFGKTCIQKTLDKLVEEEKITEKVYGKQKIYVANQDNFPTVDDSQLKDMDKKVSQLQQNLQEDQRECKILETTLSSLTHSLITDEAKTQIKALEKEILDLNQRLDSMKSGKDSVSPEESARIHRDHEECVRHWRKRKRMANDILNGIFEEYPKPKKVLYEDVGIETDEDYGVKLPT